MKFLLNFSVNYFLIQILVFYCDNQCDGLPSSSNSNSYYYNHRKYNNNTETICTTSGCVIAAAKILNTIDTTVNPCNDFYNFACGSFIKNTDLTCDTYGISEFSELDKKIKKQLHAAMSDDKLFKETEALEIASILYEECMNIKKIESECLKPMKEILKELGGWPVLFDDINKWNRNGKWSFINSIIHSQKLGYSNNYIFSTYIAADLKNSTKKMLYFDQPSTFVVAKNNITDPLADESLNAYHKAMVDTVMQFNNKKNKTNVEKDMLEVLKFEVALAQICSTDDERSNFKKLYNPMKFKDAKKKYPFINFEEYINKLIPPGGMTVDENDYLSISEPNFFEKIEEIIKNTSNKVIANYLIWRIVQFSSYFLCNDIRSVAGFGTDNPERWMECLDVTSSSLPISIGAIYVRKYFKPDDKKKAVAMANEIKVQFDSLLRSITWLDGKTKKAAIKKLKAMHLLIGYPDELFDNKKLEEYYWNLELDDCSYLHMYLSIAAFTMDYMLEELDEPIDKNDWRTHSETAVVNAFYSFNDNNIECPAGILQGNFFSSNRPEYLNYGSMGFVIGHEVTHGFDNQGREFDANGNLFDWWEPQAEAEYLRRTMCIIDQYNQYKEPVSGLMVNGELTVGENIADNGGIITAYSAYLNWAKLNGPEQKLPGLNYTQQQLFWISAAQTWCSVYHPLMAKLLILYDVHSPARFRVIGPMSNIREFSNDFHCPNKAPMNPEHKCIVWGND